MQQENCLILILKKQKFSKKQWTIHFHDISSQDILRSAFICLHKKSPYIRNAKNDFVKKVTLNFTAQLKEVQKSYSYLIIETNVRFYRAVISLRDDNLSLLLDVFKYDKMSCTLFEYLIFIVWKFCWMTTIWFSTMSCV